MAFLQFVPLLFSRVSADTTFTLINECASTVWPAIFVNTSLSSTAGIVDPIDSGYALTSSSHLTTGSISTPWSGRIWARQECMEDGTNCTVGDCGASSCVSSTSVNTTLFELTVDATDDIWYDISLGKTTYPVALLVSLMHR